MSSPFVGANVIRSRLPSEGDTFHYQWKWNETIGPLTQRPGRPGTWGYENTDGLGLIEYLHARLNPCLDCLI